MKKIFLFILIGLVVTACDLLSSTSEVSIEDWGPRDVSLASPPNIQTDGGIGLWIKAKGIEYGDQIVVDSKEMPSAVSDELITTSVQPSSFEEKQSIKVQIVRAKDGKKFDVGVLKISK